VAEAARRNLLPSGVPDSLLPHRYEREILRARRKEDTPNQIIRRAKRRLAGSEEARHLLEFRTARRVEGERPTGQDQEHEADDLVP
jgi:hypothetical protein